MTEEEIRMMLAEGKEQGTIQNEESKLIQNVFEFNDTTAEQVSTRRRDLVCLNLEDNAEEWEKTIRECRFHIFRLLIRTRKMLWESLIQRTISDQKINQKNM